MGMNSDDDAAVDEGFVAFAGRQAKAFLYKLAPMSDTIKAEMTAYVHDGWMQKDLRFAREVFGRTNTSGRKDFLDFWESPWVEEHLRDTPKKRRMDSQQKASAMRNYVKNASAQDGQQDINKYMQTVDTLSRWQDLSAENEDVKTVSRLVQSFERVAVRLIATGLEDSWAESYGNAREHMNRIPDVTVICHTLRRHDALFDLFAAVVATEMAWVDATNGSRSTTIHMCNQILENKELAVTVFVRALNAIVGRVDADTVGIPLMRINCNMCVSSNGILIMGKDSTDAVYVLDMINSFNANGKLDLTDIKTIHISQQFSEKDEVAMQAARQQELDKAPAAAGLLVELGNR